VAVQALNDNDEAVGYEENAKTGGNQMAVVWTNGEAVPLTSLIAGGFSGTLVSATDVNNNGSILADGYPAGSTTLTSYLLEAPQYEVSGKVEGIACGEGGTCSSSALGGITVLVKGRSSTGAAVRETATSDDTDGTWSVHVPGGTSLGARTRLVRPTTIRRLTCRASIPSPPPRSSLRLTCPMSIS
jgi:hypothetical protein